MPKRTIDFCLDLMQKWRNEGVTGLPAVKLQEDISVHIGAKDGVAERYIRFMLKCGLLAKNGEFYEPNYERAGELML